MTLKANLKNTEKEEVVSGIHLNIQYKGKKNPVLRLEHNAAAGIFYRVNYRE